jgi:RNA-directed DNA polymerase
VNDFLVTSSSKDLLKKNVLPAISTFLSVRGLSLNIEKTRYASVVEGFDFLGFNFKR